MGTTSSELWTIGHWTCPKEVVLDTLASADIETVVDVRKMPGSRRSPQFDADAMPSWLDSAGIGYRHFEKLGGRRPRQRDIDPAINAGWQNASFKNYADYTLTGEFEDGLAELTALASAQRVAILCGEPMPWRCHRSLIANTLTARGWTVVHLMNGAKPRLHELGLWGAKPTVGPEGVVTYPAADPEPGRSPGPGRRSTGTTTSLRRRNGRVQGGS
ncbi:DUF488 domain-containing protein [Rhodococcus sp. CH91]|uniref:DUF488 domain-containing protein n=1 Tax=Rhodococcus sp. CH91 TaxID=2910256 RepID=UPI001F4AE748|nr:DUF488 domain-containing protein [Rhodococcus sp. CH91]